MLNDILICISIITSATRHLVYMFFSCFQWFSRLQIICFCHLPIFFLVCFYSSQISNIYFPSCLSCMESSVTQAFLALVLIRFIYFIFYGLCCFAYWEVLPYTEIIDRYSNYKDVLSCNYLYILNRIEYTIVQTDSKLRSLQSSMAVNV